LALATARALASDPNGDALTYSIANTGDGAKFAINSSSGAVTFRTSPDFENFNDVNGDGIYTLTVEASDGTNKATKAITITISDVNDSAPVITSSIATSVAENVTTYTTVYQVSATDADSLPTLTYSLGSGTDDSKFAISPTGGVTFRSSPDYEASDDNGKNRVYDITVNVSDGKNNTTQNVAITLTDVNELGLNGAAYSWVGASGHAYGLYKVAKTWDAAKLFAGSVGGYLAKIDSPTENSEIFRNVQQQFSMQDYTASKAAYNAGGVAYVWLGANDAATEGSWRWAKDDSSLSYMNWGSGALGSEPDNYSNQDYLALGLQNWPAGSSNGSGFGTAGQWNDVDGALNSLYFVVEKDTVGGAPPVIVSGTATRVAEGVGTTTAVYTVSAMGQDAGATLTYSFAGGADESKFTMDSSGVVKFKTSPDYENPDDAGANHVYDIVVKVSDGTNANTQSVAITVTDVNDNVPVITTGTAVTVAENYPTGSAIYTVSATDADAGTTLTYAFAGGADDSKFTIDSAGVVKFKTLADYENPDDAGGNHVYDIVVRAYDGANAKTQAVAITVTDVNDSVPVIRSGTGTSVAEGVATTTAVYTVSATDAELCVAILS